MCETVAATWAGFARAGHRSETRAVKLSDHGRQPNGRWPRWIHASGSIAAAESAAAKLCMPCPLLDAAPACCRKADGGCCARCRAQLRTPCLASRPQRMPPLLPRNFPCRARCSTPRPVANALPRQSPASRSHAEPAAAKLCMPCPAARRRAPFVAARSMAVVAAGAAPSCDRHASAVTRQPVTPNTAPTVATAPPPRPVPRPPSSPPPISTSPR